MRCRSSITVVALATAPLAGCRTPDAPTTTPVALDLTVTAAGLLTDTATYGIVISDGAHEQRLAQRVPYGGGHVVIEELPPRIRWVTLALPPSCWLDGYSPQAIGGPPGGLTHRTFVTSCFGPGASILVATVVPAYATASRFVLEPEQRFRLQDLVHDRIGQALGSYTDEGALLRFSFDADPAWTATGTFAGACLSVDFNSDMEWADFVDTTYCAEELEATLPSTAPNDRPRARLGVRRPPAGRPGSG